jgi:hypothetical protein
MSATAQPTPTLTEAARLADQLERAHRGGSWHGPSFSEAVAGLDAASAARRPIPEAHTAWEIVAHVSSWLDVGRRRIEGETAEVSPSLDWRETASAESSDAGDAAWRAELATLEERFAGFHAAVARLDDARLDAPVAGSDPTVRGLIYGLLQHHAYHGGQLVLLGKSGGAR